jgi:hypothetical protein
MNGNQLLSAWVHRSTWEKSAFHTARPEVFPMTESPGERRDLRMIVIRSRYCAILSAFIFLFLHASSRGQKQPTPTGDETQHMQAFFVTGSIIPNAGEALAIPASIISPSDIANSGVETNALDVLRKISPAISGIGGETATFSAASTMRRGPHRHNTKI